MNGVTKFVIGAAVTSLMAMASHSGLSRSFIDGLGTQAQGVVSSSGLTGVTAAMATEPMLERVIVLSGTASAADRARLEEQLLAIPGVAGIRWATDSAVAEGAAGTGSETAAAEAAATTTATTETTPQPVEVRDCQADLNAAGANRTIEFQTAQASIRPEANELVTAIAQALAACGNVRVEVAGHTDSVGEPGPNQALSEARARSVVAALTAQGAPADRLSAVGYGETRPRVPGAGAAVDAQNRRIEFVVSSAG